MHDYEVGDMCTAMVSHVLTSCSGCYSQDSAALANTDYVQLEALFQELLRAPVADGTTGNCLAGNLFSGVSCSTVSREASLERRRVPVAAAVPAQASSAAAGKQSVTVAKPVKAKAASAPAKASCEEGTLLFCTLDLWH